MFLNQLQQKCIRGKVAFGSYTLKNIPVLIIIEVGSVRAYVKEAERSEPLWLMNLKVQYDRFAVFHVC